MDRNIYFFLVLINSFSFENFSPDVNKKLLLVFDFALLNR